jgi:hypothetical protein
MDDYEFQALCCYFLTLTAHGEKVKVLKEMQKVVSAYSIRKEWRPPLTVMCP